MKKAIKLIFVLLLTATLFACSSTTSTTTSTTAEVENTTITETTTEVEATTAAEEGPITITYNGETYEFEKMPERVVCLDMAALDIMNALGLGEYVVGASKVSLSYLSDYADLGVMGSVKEADLEAVNNASPDLIFIGGRLSKSIDDIAAIAPTILVRSENESVIEKTRENANMIASIFGVEDKVEDMMSGYETRAKAIADQYAGNTAIILLTTGGAINVLGNDGRCSIVGIDLGFDNVGVDAEVDTATHGNEVGFEFIAEKNPEYIFVMDRDAAIGRDGTPAADLLNNDLVNGTTAATNGHIVIFDNPGVWYLAEGGLTALDIMLSDVENGLAQ